MTPGRIVTTAALAAFVLVACALLVAALRSASRQALPVATAPEPTGPARSADELEAQRLAGLSGAGLRGALMAYELGANRDAGVWALHSSSGAFRGSRAVLCGRVIEVHPDPEGRGPVLRVEVDELPVMAIAYERPTAGVVVGADVCVYGRVPQGVPLGTATVPGVLAVAVVPVADTPSPPRRRTAGP